MGVKNLYSKKAQYQVIRETKDSYRRISLVRLCRLLGVTRQAFYQHFWFSEDLGIQLSLITDAYSHKIVGFNIADNMGSVNTLQALEMALQHHRSIGGLIHHSDRGIQYCSYEYVKLLQKHNISMTESGDPLENA